MIKAWNKIKSLYYYFIRTDAITAFNFCISCKSSCRNFTSQIYKAGYLIGYDKVLNEWVILQENNFFVKVCIINQDIVYIRSLTEELYNNIVGLCRKCITKYMNKAEQ